jgi:hypothetical protein
MYITIHSNERGCTPAAPLKKLTATPFRASRKILLGARFALSPPLLSAKES